MADATVINNPAKQKIGNGDAIAAVPGFDVLLIGANDLSAEMDVPGQLGHAREAVRLCHYRDAATLLADFWEDAEMILDKRSRKSTQASENGESPFKLGTPLSPQTVRQYWLSSRYPSR